MWTCGPFFYLLFISLSLLHFKLSMKQLLSSLLEETRWYMASQNATLPQGSGESLWQAWNPSETTIFATLGVFLLLKVLLDHEMLKQIQLNRY